MSSTGFSADPKDVNSYPYTGRREDVLVGIFGGTGCYRHWDFLDLNDASPWRPLQTCGDYVQVSAKYRKWVNLARFPHAHNSWEVWPIKGDVVIVSSLCDIQTEGPIYILMQYPHCGKAGVVRTLCDDSGKDVSEQYAPHCELAAGQN